MGCPMGFGELNIPSSRAFWDDCDEDECNQKPVEKYVHKSSHKIRVCKSTSDQQLFFSRLSLKYVTTEEDVKKLASKCKQMFVIEGISIVEFAEATLLRNAEKLADIPSKKSSLHYVKDKQMLIVIIEEDLTYSGEICELLLDLCQPEKLSTLTVKSKVDYKSENIAAFRDEITFLRSIDGNLNVQKLESPNFIAGVAAGRKYNLT